MSLPDYIAKFKTKGTAIHKINNSYYLYSAKAYRVKGRKNPKVKYTYLGVIDKNLGLVKMEDLVVYEYGIARTVLFLLQKEIVFMKSNDYSKEEINLIIYEFIKDYSTNSYFSQYVDQELVLDQYKLDYLNSIKKSVIVPNYISDLGSIYYIKRGKWSAISKIDDKSIDILNNLGLSIADFKIGNVI